MKQAEGQAAISQAELTIITDMMAMIESDVLPSRKALQRLNDADIDNKTLITALGSIIFNPVTQLRSWKYKYNETDSDNNLLAEGSFIKYYTNKQNRLIALANALDGVTARDLGPSINQIELLQNADLRTVTSSYMNNYVRHFGKDRYTETFTRKEGMPKDPRELTTRAVAYREKTFFPVLNRLHSYAQRLPEAEKNELLELRELLMDEAVGLTYGGWVIPPHIISIIAADAAEEKITDSQVKSLLSAAGDINKFKAEFNSVLSSR